MPTTNGDLEVGGKLFEQVDVGDQAGAGEHAFEQVVTQEGIVGHTAFERSLERVDVVDALARVGPLAEQVLVDVGNGGGVGIDAPGAGDHSLVNRAPRSCGQRRRDPRLENRVPLDHTAQLGVEARPVDRVG